LDCEGSAGQLHVLDGMLYGGDHSRMTSTGDKSSGRHSAQVEETDEAFKYNTPQFRFSLRLNGRADKHTATAENQRAK